jgi:5-methylcytosine-specific restriction enzyme A
VLNAEDTRKRALAVRREERKAFRLRAIKQYSGKCVISGCDIDEVLDAAHIVEYKGRETNVKFNVLLLRTDLHRLFDNGLLTLCHTQSNDLFGLFETGPVRVHLASAIRKHAQYAQFHHVDLFRTVSSPATRELLRRRAQPCKLTLRK